MKSYYISIQNKKYPINIIECSSEHYPEHTHTILEFSSKIKIDPLHIKEISKNTASVFRTRLHRRTNVRESFSCGFKFRLSVKFLQSEPDDFRQRIGYG